MKKMLAVLVALTLGFQASASVVFQNYSGSNLGSVNSVQCGSNMSCSMASGATRKLALNLNSALVGMRQTQVAGSTAGLTVAQCGATFINSGAGAVATLPEASTALGCRYTFVCGDGNDFDVNPNDGTDQILSVSTTNGTTGVVTLAPSAGDAVRCTDAGGSLTLEAVGANAWAQVAGGNGIWTDVN